MRMIVILTLLCGACAHTKSTHPKGEPKLDVATKNGVPGWVCVDERQTGTMISRRVCRTKQEMAENEARGNETVNFASRRGSQQVMGGDN